MKNFLKKSLEDTLLKKMESIGIIKFLNNSLSNLEQLLIQK